eukprot:92533-Pyramimonas_sp.AAC.1
MQRLLGLSWGRAVAAKIASRGLVPSLFHGANCTGLNDTEPRHSRTVVRQAIEPRPQGKSLTACLM